MVESKPVTLKRSGLESFKRSMNILNHTLIGFTLVYTLWVCCKNGLDKFFTWHVILCVLGFNVLMTESILLLYSGNTWAQVLTLPQRRTAHWILQVVGSVCVIVGIALEYYWRDVNNKAHFSQTHSILGLIALALMLFSMSNGLGALYAIELRHRIKPNYLKISHSLIGLACFVIGMVSLIYGYKKRIFKENSIPELLVALRISAVLIILLSVAGALETIVSRINSFIRNTNY